MLSLDCLAVEMELVGWARTTERPAGMPDISASIGLLDATCFLYPSIQAAEAGEGFGGSAAVVAVPLASRPDLAVRYVVTNWHVAVNAGCSVIRINKRDGTARAIDVGPEDWHFLPGGPDLAAIQLNLTADDKVTAIPTNVFVTGGAGEAFVGDDVFTVGRFIDYDGRETNRPSLRFGAISMMEADIRQGTGFHGRSIIVDTHSRTGFSGSPVYIYRPGTTTQLPFSFKNSNLPKRSGPKASHRTWGVGNDTQVKLLGIHWGQFPERWEINSAPAQPKRRDENSIVRDGEYVEGLSGMSCICPASQVLNLLHCDKLSDQRRALEASGVLNAVPKPEV